MQQLGRFLAWYFSELRWIFNPDYAPEFSPQFNFVGNFFDLDANTLSITLKRFWKLSMHLHTLFDTETLSPQTASKMSGTLESLTNFSSTNRIFARIFSNFIFHHMGSHNWAEARKLTYRQWVKSYPLPHEITETLFLFSQHLQQLTHHKSPLQNVIHNQFDIYSDANDKLGFATLFLNDTQLDLNLTIISEEASVSSPEFELQSIERSLSHFQPILKKFPPHTTALNFHCDNTATITHLKKGSRQSSQHKRVTHVFKELLPTGFFFQFFWMNRNQERIQQCDTGGRLPPPSTFNTKEFKAFVSEFFDSDFFYLTPDFSTLRHLRILKQSLCQQIQTSTLPVLLGPLYDSILISHILKKLAQFKQRIFVILPVFPSQPFSFSLKKLVKKQREIPFKFHKYKISKAIIKWHLILAEL
jgi:hypothetical protein